MSPDPRFGHLLSLATPLGVHEHAHLDQPRREHGFCLDDVARVLVVTAREPEPSAAVRQLAQRSLDFVVAAGDREGRFRNRRSASGAWTDEPSCADHWGRAIWGLSQVVRSPWAPQLMKEQSLAMMRRALWSRSRWRRSMSYAAIGAAELLRARPDDRGAATLLGHARVVLGRGTPMGMPWPEPRLTYANAVIPEAQLAIGQALGDERSLTLGLRMLQWLVELQTREGHLSLVPTGGWAPGERLPGFDQQPVEAAAIAEAAARAHAVTGDDNWAQVVVRAARWFDGANDVGIPMWDDTGAGYDGLTEGGRNENRGAESTLAALATVQLAREHSASARALAR